MLNYIASSINNITRMDIAKSAGTLQAHAITSLPDAKVNDSAAATATTGTSLYNSTLYYNRDGLTDEDIQRDCMFLEKHCQFRIVVDVYIVSLLCAVGFIGNTISIIVLRTDNINKMVSFLLQALAVADNAYLVICLGLQTFKAVNDCTEWIPGFYNVFPHVERFVWPFASIAQMSAVWLVVLVTLDRYMAICRPFDRLRVWLTLYARRVAFIIPAVALLYNLPRFFEQITIVLPELCTGQTKTWIMYSALRKDKYYYIIYKVCMFFVFRMIIPMSMLLILNVKLIQTLTVAKKDRVKLTLTQTNPRKDSFTLILVVVVTVFICCQSPDFILRVIATLRYFARFKMNLEYVNTITNLLLTVNSSINCLIYCLTGRRFRCILKRLLCRYCYKWRDSQRLGLMDEGVSSENTSVIRRNKAPTITTETSLFFPQNTMSLQPKVKTPNEEIPFVAGK